MSPLFFALVVVTAYAAFSTICCILLSAALRAHKDEQAVCRDDDLTEQIRRVTTRPDLRVLPREKSHDE